MTFEEFLDKHGIPSMTEGHHHCHAGWCQFDCPMCSPSSGKFRMGYNISKGHTYCYVCGYHWIGNVIRAIADVKGGQARKILAEIDRPSANWDGVERTGKLVLPLGVGRMGRAHKDYLRSRGLNPGKIQTIWAVGGIGIGSDELSWRLWTPIHLNGAIVSWTTRSIYDNEGGYDVRHRSARPNQEVVNHKSLLYGEDYAGNNIIIVEGTGDVWRIGPGAVGTFGTSYTRAQILRMSKYPKRGVCLDNEPIAQERARRLVADLQIFPGETYNLVIDAKDPGSAPQSEVNALRRFLK